MFISCPEISIFLVKTTCEMASVELVPSLQFVKKSTQVSSAFRLRSALICQESPPFSHSEKRASPNPNPRDKLIDQIPNPPPLKVNIDRCITQI